VPRPKVLKAFSKEEVNAVQQFLAIMVVRMMGRKLEEGDWSEVYCKAKGIELKGWSNLNIDVTHGTLGVEHKMLCWKSNKDIREACGTSLMHPALTRSIRMPAITTPPDDAMADVLTQYGGIVEQRRQKIIESTGQKSVPDMRVGWLLWQESLRQFLYFEEEMLKPDPNDYRAQWITGKSRGARKPSTNLWIYEKATGAKRYSVTNEAGVKIQPYFDVPPLNDPNLYVWTIIGEVVRPGVVRVWIAEKTAREIEKVVGTLTDIDKLSAAILDALRTAPDTLAESITATEKAVEVLIKQDAYEALCEALKGVNDDHQFQLLLDIMHGK